MRFGRNDVIEIREFQVDDVDTLVALFDVVLPGFSSALATDLAGPRAFLQDPTSFALGAYLDETPVGLAWGLQMRSPSGRLTTYVHELDVREEWRRQGIGTALISHAIALARLSGSTKFWLSTGGHNEVAQALYDSLGGDRKPLGDVNYWWNLD
jgi:ribosomal protein S18 acetylase RimI-like enzyme